MEKDYTVYRDAIRNAIVAIDDPEFESLLNVAIEELKLLYEKGKIRLANDAALTGLALELRVKQLFKDISIDVHDGRAPNLEDLILHPGEKSTTQKPIVVEVKSSKKPQIILRDLRQLDERVYDLSGEEKARKQGLEPEVVGMMTSPWTEVFTKPGRHPSPHKGAMIFNGPIGVPFKERGECMTNNNAPFVDKRNLCIIPFGTLLGYHQRIVNQEMMAYELWEMIHKTAGVLL